MEKGRKWAMMGTGALCASVALVLFTPMHRIPLVLLAVGKPVSTDQGEVIVVLGGGFYRDGSLPVSTTERLARAVDLYHQRPRRILLSDGFEYEDIDLRANDAMAHWLVQRDVPRDALVLEGQSLTTTGNALFSAEIIEGQRLGTAILVTSPYHQRRSADAFAAYLDGSLLVADMPEAEVYGEGSPKLRLRWWRQILHELGGLTRDALFGYEPGEDTAAQR